MLKQKNGTEVSPAFSLFFLSQFQVFTSFSKTVSTLNVRTENTEKEKELNSSIFCLLY